MGVVKGLKAITQHNEEVRARREAASAPKATWFQLAKDGESAKVRFLQELDEDSPLYSEKNDLGFLAVEHSSPSDYKRKALCTADEGDCYACDQHRALNASRDPDYKGGWKPKTRLYINVLVEKAGEDPYVAVLSQGVSAKQVTPALLAIAEDGPITDKVFKIIRNGTGVSDTSYTMIPVGSAPADQNVEDFELFDLEKVVRSVPFEEQAAHYGATAKAERPSAVPSTASSAVDDSW